MRISRLLILVLLLSILSLINPFEAAKTLVIQGAAQAASFNPDPSLVSWLEGKARQLVSESRSMTTSSDVAPYYPPAGKHPPNPGYLNAFIGDFSLLAVDSHLVPIEDIKEYVRWHLRRQREDGRIAHYITPDGEDTNPPWSQLSGSLSVVNGEYHQSQVLDNAFVLAGDASWSDYALRMRIKLAPASRDGGMGSIFRCMDKQQLHAARAQGRFQSDQVVEDRERFLLEHRNGHLAIQHPGRHLVFDPGGKPRRSVHGLHRWDPYVEATDSSLPTGGIGCNAGGASWFDDVLVTPMGLRGDVNNDGVVDSLDIQLCSEVILGFEARAEIKSRADANEDGIVNALDVQRITKIAVRRQTGSNGN